MKKVLIALLALTCLTGCSKTETEHTSRIVSARYYTCGEVITEDGNAWGYSQDVISEKESYDNQPVFAVFDDNGTPDDIYDDEILGLTFDRETAIYDELEKALSESFAIERNGNRISISNGN